MGPRLVHDATTSASGFMAMACFATLPSRLSANNSVLHVHFRPPVLSEVRMGEAMPGLGARAWYGKHTTIEGSMLEDVKAHHPHETHDFLLLAARDVQEAARRRHRQADQASPLRSELHAAWPCWRVRAGARHAGPLSQAFRKSRGPNTACHTVPRWCALYINLDRRPDRRGRLKELLMRHNAPLWERLERVQAPTRAAFREWQAVDKQDLSLDDEVVLEAVAPHALERARRAQEENHYTIVHDEVRSLSNPFRNDETDGQPFKSEETP